MSTMPSLVHRRFARRSSSGNSYEIFLGVESSVGLHVAVPLPGVSLTVPQGGVMLCDVALRSPATKIESFCICIRPHLLQHIKIMRKSDSMTKRSSGLNDLRIIDSCLFAVPHSVKLTCSHNSRYRYAMIGTSALRYGIQFPPRGRITCGAVLFFDKMSPE